MTMSTVDISKGFRQYSPEDLREYATHLLGFAYAKAIS